MEYLWVSTKVDWFYSDSDEISTEDCCNEIEQDLCFHLGKSMCKKNHSVFNDHINYIKNDIHNSYKVVILHCAKHVRGLK